MHQKDSQEGENTEKHNDSSYIVVSVSSVSDSETTAYDQVRDTLEKQEEEYNYANPYSVIDNFRMKP